MAEIDPVFANPAPSEQAEMGEEERLRYLAFVYAAVAQAVTVASALYDKAKEGAGPLRPGVEGVEETVKAVVGPVYDKLHGVPLDCLRYLDRKVGESVEELDRHVPAVVKEAPTMARSAAVQVQQGGLFGTAAVIAKSAIAKAEPVARDLYVRYEPVAERTAAEAWRSLNKLPIFPSVARTVVPVAANLSERYNAAVQDSAKQGHAVATYLPLIPTEHIARVFSSPPVASQ